MPRRKIGADLKEALCKLYEAGDISAETIEKHGLMSRATFFRNLKMYKTGASLEQRHSTGRKTNADKLKEQEKQELDSLRPAHLSHLELVLLLDDDDRSAQNLAARNKRKAKASAASSSKRRDTGRGTTGYNNDLAAAAGDDSGSDSDDGELDEGASLASRQALEKLTQAARSFLMSSDINASSEPSSFNTFADLDSLLRPEDSHYSHSNRGALYVVRRRTENKEGDGTGDIIAAIALRSLIWTPQIYQALGPSYASRSIDKVFNLSRLRVDPMWQRKGIGRWLVSAAELKASKLGFSHLYTQSDANRAELLSFWRRTGFNEVARLDNVARLEKVVVAPVVPFKGEGSKRVARSPPIPTQTGGTVPASTSPSAPMHAASSVQHGVAEGTSYNRQRTDAGLSVVGGAESSQGQPNLFSSEIDPAIPSDLTMPWSASSNSSTSAAAATLSGFSAMSTTSMLPPQTSSTNRPRGQLASGTAAAATTATFPPASISSSFSADPSSPALEVASPIAAPPLPPQTPHDPTPSTGGPPPRRIAFHEANSVGNRPATN
ncbi:uncharacterized protein UTRI_10536_B [Ustilago trichophora]|uniref:N-acetyltransferase domain-containing protein n=1 Tax=Ustilago trichophora TaxID=86804 RepID=A0A5C3EBS9_9BASI|nr:uncharacterized protein UTRI_10536_B [Ustilago trichophora]